MFDDSTHKKCSKCGEVKLRGEFYRDKRKKDGLRSDCSKCNKESRSKWRKLNKDKIKNTSKIYYDNNKDIINEKSRIYHKQNKKKLSKKRREYYKKNKDKIKKYLEDNQQYIANKRKEYYENNKEYLLKKNREYHKNNREKINERARRLRSDANKTQLLMMILNLKAGKVANEK